MLINTKFYAYNVRIYYTIDLWTSMTYCCCVRHCRVCLYYAVWYSHDPFRHGMIPACADRTAALITSKKREIRYLTLRRAPVDVGGLYLAKQAKSGAAEPHEICSSSCTNL